MLNAKKIDNFVEKILFYWLHREASAEGVDDGFATATREVDFDAEAEALFGNKNGGVMIAFLLDAESAEILVGMLLIAFGEAFAV